MVAQSASVMPRQLTPTLPAQELLQRAENTQWNRELHAASEIVKKRRRQLRYNDYLPEDAPGSLLVFDEDPNNAATTTCLSPLQKWFVSLIESIGIDTWDEIDAYNITSLAYLYKHHISSADGTNEYFGTYGDRTDEMQGNHQALKGFWSTGSSNIILLGMHGVDLAEDTKLIPTLQQMYTLDASEAYALGGRIKNIVESLPGAFNNPVLTANAIAIQSLNSDGSKSERDSIIVGDGVLAFLTWLNLKDDGPDYIHSHEFGHHLQYDIGVDKVGNGWSSGEETRRWEMMADVFGSYYLAHAKGGRMDANRLMEVHRAAFSLGDCQDAIGSHHGTPRQRECASNYGADLALISYMDDGYRIPPLDLRRMFDEKYQKILELDDDQCKAVMDSSLLDKAIYGEIVGSSVGSSVGTNKPPPQDLDTPSWDVPAPSPAGNPQSEYEPSSGYVPQSEYEPFNSAPQNGNGWNGGTPFESYNPEENSPPENNELDEPPPLVQNGTHAEDQGWFGEAESQWIMPRSGGQYLGVRSTLIAAVVVKIILSLA